MARSRIRSWRAKKPRQREAGAVAGATGALARGGSTGSAAAGVRGRPERL